jgi:Flp pilus assembly protein CpaB
MTLPRRSLAVLIATALALLVSAGAYVGLHSAQQKAVKNASATFVYVLTGTVPPDDSVATAYSDGLIRQVRTRSQFVPIGAIRNLALIHDDLAWYSLPAGEVVVNGMFVSPGSIGSVAAKSVPSGDVAVSVTANQVHSVAGLIQPGDEVDIMVDIDGNQERYLYRSVRVLAVGTTLVPAPVKTSSYASVSATLANNVITFAVPFTYAPYIAQANNSGSGVIGGVYLALAGVGNGATPIGTVTASNLLQGGPSNASSTDGGSNSLLAGPMIGEHVERSETNENTP